MTRSQTSAKGVHVVGIGGTLRPGSTTEKALRFTLDCIARAGAQVTLFCGPDLDLPIYAPERGKPGRLAEDLVDALRRADAVILASPSYHGGISGLIKNVLDYSEELRSDVRPYLDGRPVGCIVTAGGWQGTVTTLMGLRCVIHALRGWPTPLGVTINTGETRFTPDGRCSSPAVETQLGLLAEQILDFSSLRPLRAPPALRAMQPEPLAGG